MWGSFDQVPLGVVPVLINPIAVLLAVLPGILMALLSLLKPRSLLAGLRMLWRMKLQVAAGVAVIYGIRLGLNAWRADGGAAVGEVEAADRDWPVFRGDVHRSGWVRDGEGDPVGGGVNWSFREDDQAFLASPAVRGNRVYVPSVTIGAFGGLSGAIYAFDADTGAVVWKTGPRKYRGSFSSAVVEGDALVVGEGLHITTDARAVCLDISDEAQPRVRWTFATESHIEGTPAIEDGRVFFTAGNDGVYGVDLETGEELWHVSGEEIHDPETSILAHEGRVYVGLGFGRKGQALLVIDAGSGEVLHRIRTPYPVFSPPAVYGDRLYVGMGNGDFVFPAEDRVDYVLELLKKQGADEAELERRREDLGPGGAIWAFDLETMERVWEVETERTILSSITATENGLYAASRSGNVYHLDFEGRKLATWNAGEPVLSSLSVTDEHVYLMTARGTVFVLREADLSPVWDFSLGQGSMNFSSPAVARGRMFVGTETAGMVSLGEPRGEAGRAVWSGPGGGPRVAGRADERPLPALGAFARSEPEEASGGGDEGRVWLTRTPLAVEGVRLRAFDAPEPRVVAEVEGEAAWSRELPGAARGLAVVGDTLAVVVGGESPQLLFMEVFSGESRGGEALTPGEGGPMLAATGEGFFVQVTEDEWAGFDPEGERVATFPWGTFAYPPEVLGHQVVGVRSDGRTLATLDRPTGVSLWERRLEGAAAGGPVLDGSRVLVPTDRGLEAAGRLDGATPPGWQGPGAAMSDSVSLARTRLAVVSKAGDLWILDRETGKRLNRFEDALPGFRPLWARDRLFWLAEGAVRVVDFSEAEPKPAAWVDTSWLGRPTTGMLAVEGRVFVGYTDWGLVEFEEAR